MTDRDAANGRLNATILDPSRWGWTAGSGVADLLTPHERARRSATKKAFLRSKRKRDWSETQSTHGVVVAGSSSSREPGRETPLEESSSSPAKSASTAEEGDRKPPDESSDTTVQLKKAPPQSLPPSNETKPEPADVNHFVAPVALTRQTDSAPAQFSALKKRKITGGDDDGAAAGDGDVTADCLDWYTYHRGRAGMEMRDEETGDLLYDLPTPTDTNHNADEPNWSSAKIFLKFPLDDRSREESGSADGRRHMFRETVLWDWLGENNLITDEHASNGQKSRLLESSGLLNRTPMEMAATIAEEYGLTFAETVDLADYIQAQLRSWVKDEAPYIPPYTYIDPITDQRRERPSATTYELYGDAISMSEGGLEDKPTVGIVKSSSSINRNFPVPRRPSSMESSKKSKGSKAPVQKKESKKISKPDSECMDEVHRRLLAESEDDIKRKSTGEDSVGVLNVQRNLACHICNSTEGLSAQFCCGVKGHVYCRLHMRQKIGLALDGTDPVTLTHCPVCALHCSCDPCVMTLEKLAIDFKARNLEQGCPLRDTKFNGLLEKARSKRAEVPANSKPRFRRKALGTEKMDVPKIPVTDLPREVSDGLDVDPGTDADYAALWTEKGPIFPPGLSFNVKPVATDLSVKASFSVEDGSVDFCNMCRNIGNLVCCDFCPRAFHAECLKSSGMDEPSDSQWECPCCRAEKVGLEEDKVDASKSMEQLSPKYASGDDGRSTEQNMLTLLASIHQMLLRLMEYDFGYMFNEPVDTSLFPDYLKIVQKPMDLGTIAKNLIEGTYRESPAESLESVAIKVLQDVELVWKNCYLFNVEGSSVYRMALVQERRANAIRNKSFSHLLTDKISKALGYEDSTEKPSSEEQPPATNAAQGVVRPQKSRHKITVSRRNHNGHHIAVLDPDTCKIVKIYSTMQAAGAAVVFMLTELKHRCEWQNIEVDTVQKVRKIIKTSNDKPFNTLFGYRWLMLQSLRSGEVAFPKRDPSSFASTGDGDRAENFIKKTDCNGNVVTTFESVDDAYEDFVKTANGASIAMNGHLNLSRFESEYLRGGKDLKGAFYVYFATPSEGTPGAQAKMKSASRIASDRTAKESSNDKAESVPSENGTPFEVSSYGTEKDAVATDISADLGSKSDALQMDLLASSSVKDVVKGMDQNSETNTDLHRTLEGPTSNHTQRDGTVFKNGSNAASLE